MNKNIKIVLLGLLCISTLNSCRIYNTIFPKHKDNYINYSLLFADPETNNALRNRTKEDVVSDDNRIRIITINKITNDTIVEWVKPSELTNGKKMVYPTKTNQAFKIDTAYTLLTKEIEILQPHKAIVFVNSDGGTNFSKRNDTLFVNTSESKMENVLQMMLGKNIENTPIIVNDAKDKNTETGKQKINDKLKNIKNKFIKNENSNISNNKNNIDTLEDITPTAHTLLANDNTLVGDLNFDTDHNAEIITDADELKKFINSQIIPWNTFKCKAKIKLKTNNDSKTFNAFFRMIKKSNTWASVHVPIIGEVARAYAKPDSMMLLDKWKNRYFHFATADLQKIIGMPIPYTSLQDYILGNPPVNDGTKMLGKRNAKGIAIKIVNPGLSCVLTYNADSTLKAVVIIGTNKGKSYSIKNNLSDYETTTNGRMSTSRLIYIIENNKETTIDLNFNKIEFEQAIDFPFTIPANFKDGNKEGFGE